MWRKHYIASGKYISLRRTGAFVSLWQNIENGIILKYKTQKEKNNALQRRQQWREDMNGKH